MRRERRKQIAERDTNQNEERERTMTEPKWNEVQFGPAHRGAFVKWKDVGTVYEGIVDVEGEAISFLEKIAPHRLAVFTGYASVWGLAWLARRTEERPVNLLIGRIDDWRWGGADEDREAALRFLARPDTDVRHWSPPPWHGYSPIVHLKAWVSGEYIFAGSANLTLHGLCRNYEMMFEPDRRFYERARRSLHHLWLASPTVTPRLALLVANAAPQWHSLPAAPPPPDPAPGREGPRPVPEIVRPLPPRSGRRGWLRRFR